MIITKKNNFRSTSMNYSAPFINSGALYRLEPSFKSLREEALALFFIFNKGW